MVKFLSFKYITNEPVTEAEIQKHVVKEYKGYYALIFRHACECMEVVFGIEVKEVDSLNHTYKLLKILDLTYDGRISNEEGIPKTGLLVLILGVIFMEGNRASEKRSGMCSVSLVCILTGTILYAGIPESSSLKIWC